MAGMFLPKALNLHGALLHSLLLVALLNWPENGHAEAHDQIVLWNRNYDTAPVDRVLELALRKTNDLYPTVSVVRSEPLEQQEALLRLRRGDHLDVVSTAANKALEGEVISIAFPVLRGLLGVRVCLIRKGEQARFSALQTPYDFITDGVRICQGAQWPDVDVLRRNGFPTVTRDRYLELFSALDEGDCDCILRGAQEILPEWESFQAALDIEEHIVFRYLQPGFLHVSKSNPQLAARIELGLLRALDDGSFVELVESLVGGAVDRLHLSDRISFDLVNPNLSPTVESLKHFDSLWHEDAH